jgi:hypothetical protein
LFNIVRKIAKLGDQYLLHHYLQNKIIYHLHRRFKHNFKALNSNHQQGLNFKIHHFLIKNIMTKMDLKNRLQIGMIFLEQLKNCNFLVNI